MFHLSYMFAELRRRRGRTILTALGLAVGVALVIMTNAVSSGLDNAQQKVLEPLTGVGTDMSVTRPLNIQGDGDGIQGLSEAERDRLREQAGPGPGLNLRDAEPGSQINVDTFSGTSELTFTSSRVARIAKIAGVEQAAGSLTLRANHISGTVPDIEVPGGGGGPGGGPPAQGAFGDSSITFDSRTVTGVDESKPDIAPVTPSQVVDGEYFSTPGKPRQAIVSSAYAGTKDVGVGDTIDLGGEEFTVIGIASSPIGGNASDVYVKLATLQKVADSTNQVNSVHVRATSTETVDPVAAAITGSFQNSQVTTASDLAARVGGSLKDTRDLSATLGRVLSIVGLVAAVLIASLLTLSSVAKRTRELGTLKAMGWSRWSVVRQISGETLLQGLIGGVVGVLIALVAIAGVNAAGWTLKASVAAADTAANGLPGGGGFGFGQAAVTAGEEVVTISTSPSVPIILAAVGLAVVGGLIAGVVGSLRAARLRPAVALRTVE